MAFFKRGANRITVCNQRKLIADGIQQSSLQLDAEFTLQFKKLQTLTVKITTSEPSPFWSLGTYIDFAMFDQQYGYYTHQVNIGLNGGNDFTTQLNNGLAFVYGILVQAYNIWLAQLKAGMRTKTDAFNIVEPGAGVGIFALKLLFILDNLDINSSHLNEEQKENWQAFSSQLRIYLSDRSPLQVININNTLAEQGKILQDQSLLEKIKVECCSLAEITTPADFLMVQEVFDVLPIERIKFTKHGVKIAIVVPTLAASDTQNKELAEWLLTHSELTVEDLQGKTVLSGPQDSLNNITWLETFVSIDYFPEVKKQVLQFYDYYASLAALETDKVINIRRYLAENLASFKHLRGAAIIFDYGHTYKDIEKNPNHHLYSIRLFPQDNLNSIVTQGMTLFGLVSNPRITINQAYLLCPGKYDITANVDFSELLHHLDEQHVPICYGPQAITASDHFIEMINSMPYFTNDFITNKYLPNYQSECDSYMERRFELESPLVISLRLFTQFIHVSNGFKQLIITHKTFAQHLKGNYRFEFTENTMTKEENEQCSFKPRF